MIADAKKAVEESSEASEEKVRAEAAVQALEQAKEAGYTLTQEDLNRVDKQNKDALNSLREDMQNTLGTGWDEFKKMLEQVATDDPEMAPSDPDSSVLDRIFDELKKRDDALESERNDRLAFQRELKQERLSHQLERQFKDLGLQESYQDAAREFVSPRLESIVDKAMKNEDVDEDLKAQAERIKELSPVWFEKPSESNQLPPYPGRSPNGGEPRQLTDEERLARSESVI
jgi:hypothetical protein